MQKDQNRTAGAAAPAPVTPAPGPLVFVHIPKTAGTTLKRVFTREYGHEALFRTLPEEDLAGTAARLRDLDDAARRRVRLIQGHMPYGLHEALGEPVRYVTMLRNPVDRVVSHYYYARRLPEHYLHQTVQNGMTLREYVETAGGGLSLEMDNGQTRSMAGAPHHLVPVGECTEDMLELAKRNLEERFGAVGLLERFDESLILFRRAYDWRMPLYVRRNVTTGRPQVREIDDETLAAIESHNRLDLELYRFATERFDHRIRELGLAFRVELRLFRMANAAYNVIRPSRDRWLQRRTANGETPAP